MSSGGSGDSSGGAYPPGLQQYGLSFQSNASVAIIIVVLGATFFFMFLFLVYIKRCSSGGGGREQSGAGGAAGAAAWGRQAAVHGLDPQILHKFPIMSYASVKRTRDSIECAVCLGQFEEKEKLRLLPGCGHSFHPECIDMWLETHSTCPLCRLSLDHLPPPAPPPLSPPPSLSPPPPSLPPSPPPPAASPETPPPQVSLDIESGRIIRTLSRNSEAFKNAAHDAELREVRERILLKSASGRSMVGGSPSSSSPTVSCLPTARCLPTTPRPPRQPQLLSSSSSRGRHMNISMVESMTMHHSQSCSDLQRARQSQTQSERWSP